MGKIAKAAMRRTTALGSNFVLIPRIVRLIRRCRIWRKGGDSNPRFVYRLSLMGRLKEKAINKRSRNEPAYKRHVVRGRLMFVVASRQDRHRRRQRFHGTLPVPSESSAHSSAGRSIDPTRGFHFQIAARTRDRPRSSISEM